MEAASSDDEFEQVTTDKKRVRKAPQQFIKQTYEAPVANPNFPASDPTKVKIIERAPKKEGEVAAAPKTEAAPAEKKAAAPVKKAAPSEYALAMMAQMGG